MPRRIGCLVEDIVDYSNLYESLNYVLRGKRKKSASGKKLWRHYELTIRTLQAEIRQDRFRLKHYRETTLTERGKERKIQSIDLYHRIGLNAVMRVVEERLRTRLILNTAASIKGRGGHWLLHRILQDLKEIPVGQRYIRKDDIRKFYENIPQELAKKVVRHYIKDPIVVNILDSCITLLPSGISIGLRSSQFLAMLVLNYVIDHKLKDGIGCKRYYRYCDDGVQVERSYRDLTRDARECHKRIEAAGMEIKPDERFWKHEHAPIDFLGYVVFADGRIRIRKHTKQRFARRWKRAKSNNRRAELLASFYGLCKHAHAKHLFHKLTGITMNSFAESGFIYKAADGKKRFNVPKYRLAELMNQTITVTDYEDGVKNHEGAERMIIRFTNQDGTEGKFWTGSEEMRQALHFMDEQDKLPFVATIKQKPIGNGKYMYVFT